MSEKSGLSYADAGVSIDEGNKLVKRIAPLARSTARPGADGALGGFGGLFDLKAAGFTDPILVAANDGVGTKLKLAIEMGNHAGVGIDLVAMCANDLIVQGAEPLFFLDYYATGRLDNDVAEAVVASIAEGCNQAGCALIGGETAEMPGMYEGEDYDLAGFCVGAAERGRLIDGSAVKPGDVLLGLASTGVHSNGFSLVRRIIEREGWNLHSTFLPDERSLGEALLAPTRIYVRPLLDPIRDGHIHALAHITGGGLLENLPRSLPDGGHAYVDTTRWSRSALFDMLQQGGNIAEEEMVRTFNCGIGMVAIVPPNAAEDLALHFGREGVETHVIGDVRAGRRGCTVTGEGWSATHEQ